MKLVRISTMAVVALAAFASGFAATVVVAQEKPRQAASGHDHEAMMKKAEQKIADALKSLPPEDQKLAAAQRFCPMMTHSRLGAMGAPVKLMVAGKPVFVCCKACTKDALKDEAATLKTTAKLVDSTAELAKLPPAERAAAEAQKYCAIANGSFLGSMGAPIKLEIDGKPVYLCCGGCKAKAQTNPAATLAKVEELKKAGMNDGHDHAGHEHADHK